MDALQRERVDVAIIGAGVGGLSAALSASQNGLRVALFDAGAIGHHRVCGEFVSPEAHPLFSRLGVLDEIEQIALPIRGARVVSRQRTGAAMPLPAPALGISRPALDGVLGRAARACGSQIFENTRVREIARHDGNFVVNDRFESRFLFVAGGRNCALTSRPQIRQPRRFLGLKCHFENANWPRDEVGLFPFRGGYCGVGAVENGAFNVCLLIAYERAAHRSPAAIWSEVTRENSSLRRVLENARPLFDWLATGNVVFNQFEPTRDGALHIGDAAGMIHPLSGDGMAMAARSGEIAVEAVKNALEHDDNAEFAARFYERAWQSEFAARLRWAARLQPLLTSPLLTPLALHAGEIFPALSRLAVRATRGSVKSEFGHRNAEKIQF